MDRERRREAGEPVSDDEDEELEGEEGKEKEKPQNPVFDEKDALAKFDEKEENAIVEIPPEIIDDIDDDWFASLDREFSDIDSGESTHVNLKLAKEYIRLGEKSGAQSLLEDVIENGADDDRQQAQKLLDSM